MEIQIDGVGGVIEVRVEATKGRRSTQRHQTIKYSNILGEPFTFKFTSTISKATCVFTQSDVKGQLSPDGLCWTQVADYKGDGQLEEKTADLESESSEWQSVQVVVECSGEWPFSRTHRGDGILRVR